MQLENLKRWAILGPLPIQKKLGGWCWRFIRQFFPKEPHGLGLLSAVTKTTLKQLNIDSAVISENCTSLIQPADISRNKSLKWKIKECYNNWKENRKRIQRTFFDGIDARRNSAASNLWFIRAKWKNFFEF